MVLELGEVRESMAWGCWNKAESIAKENSNETEPFYILYNAKPDPNLSGSVVRGKACNGGIREHFQLVRERPPFILGVLVWYVDNQKGKFEFVPELSSPPDIPLDPSLLSTRSEDQQHGLMHKAKNMSKVIPLVS